MSLRHRCQADSPNRRFACQHHCLAIMCQAHASEYRYLLISPVDQQLCFVAGREGLSNRQKWNRTKEEEDIAPRERAELQCERLDTAEDRSTRMQLTPKNVAFTCTSSQCPKQTQPMVFCNCTFNGFHRAINGGFASTQTISIPEGHPELNQWWFCKHANNQHTRRAPRTQ
jgi:hypothetical protein